MRYVELDPLPALSPFLERIWALEGHASVLEGEPQRILPDGRSELILHFGDPFERLEPDGTSTRQAPLLFAGQLSGQLLLRPTGHMRVLGLRFHPFGAAALVQPPQRDLAGMTVAMDDVSPAIARVMTEVRDRARDLEDAASLAQQALLRLIAPNRLDTRVVHVAQVIDRRHGQVSIDALAAGSGMTRRHLERQFERQVGISPKRLARIARFQRTLRFLESAEDGWSPTGALTAAACGYADQAHFVRDFRDLAGCPPTEHLVTKGVLTGFFTSKSYDGYDGYDRYDRYDRYEV